MRLIEIDSKDIMDDRKSINIPTKILSSTTVFIINNKKCLLSTKSAY